MVDPSGCGLRVSIVTAGVTSSDVGGGPKYPWIGTVLWSWDCCRSWALRPSLKVLPIKWIAQIAARVMLALAD